MQEGIPERARHPLVHLGDDGARATRRGQGAIDAEPQAHVSVFVGWRRLEQHDVERHLTGTEQRLDLAEEYGGIVGAPGAYGLPHVLPQEQPVVAEMPFILGQRVVRIAQGEHMENFYISEWTGPL